MNVLGATEGHIIFIFHLRGGKKNSLSPLCMLRLFYHYYSQVFPGNRSNHLQHHTLIFGMECGKV